MFPTGGPMPTWRAALCWFALVPFLVALSLPGKDGVPLSLRNSLLLGYLCGFLWYFGNCFWIYQTMYLYGGLPKPVSFGIVVLFSLYLGLYHALFAGLFSVLRRGKNGVVAALILTPFLWVAVELARARVTGFPWDLLGYVPVNNLVVTRLAPIAGVMGISFSLTAVNAGLSFALMRKTAAWRITAASAVIAVVLQASAGWAGRDLVDATHFYDYAVMVQENLSVGATGRGEQPMSEEEELRVFSAVSMNPQMASQSDAIPKDAELRVILWPEAPSHLQSDDPFVRQRLGELGRNAGVPVIAGSLGVDRDAASRRGYRLYDSATVFDRDGSYAGRYDKIHLVPWGEYVPFKEVFSFAEKLTEGVGDMDRGTERTVFRPNGRELRHLHLLRVDLRRRGSSVCKGRRGSPGEHFRRWLVWRNGGTLATPEHGPDAGYREPSVGTARHKHRRNYGDRSQGTSDGGSATARPRSICFSVPIRAGTTFYTRHGDWFAYLCAGDGAGGGGALAVFGFVRGAAGGVKAKARCRC